MRLLIIAAACLLLAACTGTAAAPQYEEVAGVLVDFGAEAPADSHVRIVEDIEHQTYLVSGDTASMIRASLNRYGPYSEADGRNYDAVTRWGMEWSFRYRSGPGSCVLSSGTIEVVAVTVLPELKDPERLNAQTQARWQSYIESLADHELGHVEGVQRGARALQAAFDAAPEMSSCSELGAYLKSLGDAYVEAMRSFDASYDSDTGHGRSQGAVFP